MLATSGFAEEADVVRELGRRGAAEAVDVIRARLAPPCSAELRHAAAEALGELGDPAATDDLQRTHDHLPEGHALREASSRALGRLRRR